MNKYAFIDIDSTLLKGQVQQGFIDFLYSESRLSVLKYALLSLWFVLYKMGIFSDVKKIFKFGLRSIRGLTTAEADILANRFLNVYLPINTHVGSISFIRKIRDEGYRVILLSTAIDLLVSKLKFYFNADDILCTRLEKKDDIYTGNICGELVYGENKARVLRQLIEEVGSHLSETIACADHESDLPMLKIVGRPYLANPNKRMVKIAIQNNIAIIDLRHEPF